MLRITAAVLMLLVIQGSLEPYAHSASISPTTGSNGVFEETSIPILESHFWPTGFKMNIRFQFLDDVIGGWTMTIKFSKATPGLQMWRAAMVSVSSDQTVYTLQNMPWNSDFKKCDEFEAQLIATKLPGSQPPTAVVEFHRKNAGNINQDQNACPTTLPPTNRPTTLPSSITTLAQKTTTSPLPTTTKLPTPSTIPTTLPSLPSTVWPLLNGVTATASVTEQWKTGFKMFFRFLIKKEIMDGWVIKLKFSKPALQLKIWRAKLISQSIDNTEYFATNMPFNANLPKCSELKMTFMAQKGRPNEPVPSVVVTLYRSDGAAPEPTDSTACASTIPPTTVEPVTKTTASPTTDRHTTTPEPGTLPPVTENATTKPPKTHSPATNKPSTEKHSTNKPNTQQPSTPPTNRPTSNPATTSSPFPYDYNQVLHDSILFYEAQRSGKLPSSNRIPWRGDSALNDRGQNGEDLTGGWYDAGDFVKFGFPMASSVTVLAWGLIEYRDAYKAAGELDNALDSIKWATDYFIKAHTAKYEFYGQVGDGHVDHAYWGRPEEMTMKRPAFKITTSKPGSELAAETAAALAATSIAFKPTNPHYANKLIKHAEELYEFADKYRGKYSDSIPNAASFYKSFSGFNDELVWGAAWLYRATKKPEYLSKAESYYQQFNMNGKAWTFSWDDKKAGVQLLLAGITNKANYQIDFQRYLDSWLPGGDVRYTPKGLAWRDQWGPNRYAANTAFLALLAADSGLKAGVYRTFAKNQIYYMLGDSGRSFVVGFGTNPPKRPHHRSSSCPNKPAPCTHAALNAPGPNPQTLTGALVGGPDVNDNFKDDRKDYIENEVATDYNAGFQSAVAGLKKLSMA